MAAVAEASGMAVVVPDLAPAFAQARGWASAAASLAADACPATGQVVVVGHSGAGYYLPGIGGAINLERTSFVFVDAVLPPRVGTVAPGAAIADLLDAHTRDGWLDPWIEWWPNELIEKTLPNPSDRTALRDDMPTVRRAVYEEHIPVPVSWSERPIRYVQTSAAYAAESRRAESVGWDCSTIDGTHLSIVTDPHEVLGHILDR